jgi:hypothetical protein
MVLSMKVCSTLVRAWQVFGGRADRAIDPAPAPAWQAPAAPLLLPSPAALRTIHAAALPPESAALPGGAPSLLTGSQLRLIDGPGHAHTPLAAGAHARARGIGSRFRPLPKPQELLR